MFVLGLVLFFLLGVLACAPLNWFLGWGGKLGDRLESKFFLAVQAFLYVLVVCGFCLSPAMAVFPAIESWLSVENENFRFWALLLYLVPILGLLYLKRDLISRPLDEGFSPSRANSPTSQLLTKTPRWIELIGWGLLAVFYAGLALFVGMSLLTEESPPTWLKLALIYLLVAWFLYWTFWTNAAEQMWERSANTMDKQQTVFLIKLMVSVLCISAIWFSIPMVISMIAGD